MISYIYYIVVNNGMLTMSTAKPVKFPRTINSMSAVFLDQLNWSTTWRIIPGRTYQDLGQMAINMAYIFGVIRSPRIRYLGRYHPPCIRSPTKSGWICMEFPEILPNMVKNWVVETPLPKKIKIKETSPNATERM